jgi:hypothetical protein
VELSVKSLLLLVLLSSVLSSKVYSAEACNVKLEFSTIPEKKYQEVKVADGVKLSLAQMMATKKFEGAKVASNFICQVMTGASYTGSNEEWQGFINSATQGLANSGYTNVQFIPVVPKEKKYQSELQSIEYGFIATRGDNTQYILNLAVLDKGKNAVYTISVSGNELVEKQIKSEFERLVASFIIKK